MLNGELYVDGRLNVWAEWRVRRDMNGLGYPRQSAFAKSPGSGFWSPEMESASYEIDKCVVALGVERPELKIAVMQCYTKTGTQEQKAKVCGCTRMTFHNRLNEARRHILGYLNDLAAGMTLPQAMPERAVDEKKLNYVNA